MSINTRKLCHEIIDSGFEIVVVYKSFYDKYNGDFNLMLENNESIFEEWQITKYEVKSLIYETGIEVIFEKYGLIHSFILPYDKINNYKYNSLYGELLVILNDK